MVENSVTLGLVEEIGDDETSAWLKVGELSLIDKHIANPFPLKPTFGELCQTYVRDGLPFRKKDGRRKAKGTIETYTYHINNHILPRWKDTIAEQIKPLAIRNWLVELHDGDDYTWETCSKIRGIMSLIFTFVDHNELYTIRNPLEKVTIPASEEEHDEVSVLKPTQVVKLLRHLPLNVGIAVLLVAATGLRVSELLGLKWKHIDWKNQRIQIEQTFRRGEVQKRTKTKASRAPVPMCSELSAVLSGWRMESNYAESEDFIFASSRRLGRQPLWGQTINAKYLKPAAIKLGLISAGERFGWHRFRHSLASWTDEATQDITAAQGLLRHSKPQMTTRYVHGRLARGTKAQQQYMKELYESIGIIDPNINGGLRALFRVESVPISNELEA